MQQFARARRPAVLISSSGSAGIVHYGGGAVRCYRGWHIIRGCFFMPGQHMSISRRQIRAVRERRVLLRASCALFGMLVAMHASAHAESLDGHVTNGTTKQPAAGIEVQLIQLQQGMTPVASATTNAQGIFHFDNAEKYRSE